MSAEAPSSPETPLCFGLPRERATELLDSPMSTWPVEKLPEAIDDLLRHARHLAHLPPDGGPLYWNERESEEYADVAGHLQAAIRALRRLRRVD